MTLDPKALEAAINSVCGGELKNCSYPECSCNAFPRDARAAISTYLQAAGIVEVPVIKGSCNG